MTSTGLIVAGVALYALAPTTKIPTGMCRDRKSGKSRVPLPPCDKNGKGPLLGVDRSGRPIYGACDNAGDCAPVLLDAPGASGMRALGALLVVAGVVRRRR